MKKTATATTSVWSQAGRRALVVLVGADVESARGLLPRDARSAA
ncbi:hypothetical protein [Streptomyces sp. NBC_00576]|nr:hypothetical protein [Streptomyces sp. NBC_00576]WUB69850.1 hypothetical protein OG734_07075 [Streptomyces sp. NBC_00576]